MPYNVTIVTKGYKCVLHSETGNDYEGVEVSDVNMTKIMSENYCCYSVWKRFPSHLLCTR